MVCVKPIRRSDSKSMSIMVVCFLIPVRRAIPFAVKRIGGEYGKSAARVRADQHTTGGESRRYQAADRRAVSTWYILWSPVVGVRRTVSHLDEGQSIVF